MHLVITLSQILLLAAAAAGLSMPRGPPRREPHLDSQLAAPDVFARSPSYKQPDKCKVVKKIIHDFRQEKAATAFCSAYLHVPKVTSTVTVTSYTKTVKRTTTITSGTTTKTVATNTATATVSKTITKPATVPTTTTITEFYETDTTHTITSCAVPTAGIQPRADYGKIPTKPKCLKGYGGGKVLSSACKCLDVPKATTTTTKTKKTCTTKIISVTVPRTIKVTATTTATATATTTTTSTSFSTTTATERVPIYTETVQVLATPTFQIYVNGGGNNGRRLRGDTSGYVTNDEVSPGTEPILDFVLGEEDSILTVVNGPFAGSQAETNPNSSGEQTYVRFGQSDPFTSMPCEIFLDDDGTCPLTCYGSRGTTNFDCSTYWRVASDADAAVFSCQTWRSYVVS